MGRSKRLRIALLIFLACIIAVAHVGGASAISRGEVVYEIMTALDLPVVQDGSGFADVSKLTLHGESIQAAKALGILPPFEHFYPTLDATNAEALMFALRALGLFNEAEILDEICEFGEKEDVPPHLTVYLTMAEEMSPKAPELLLNEPAANVSREGLNSLVNWLKGCKKGFIFEKTLEEGPLEVTIHREGVGRPPKLWLLLIDEIPLNAEARARDLADYLKNLGFPAFIVKQEWAYLVSVGPFMDYVKAHDVKARLPKGMTASILPYNGSEESPALYWVCLSYDATSETGKIALSSARFGTSRPLSEMAGATGAKAAVNGGYFSGTRPIGLVLTDGAISYMPYRGRTAIGWDDSGKVYIGQVEAAARVVVGSKAEFALDGVNVSPSYHGISVYSPEFGMEVPNLPSDALEVMVREGKVTWKQSAATTKGHYIPPDGFLLVARGNSRQYFANVVLGTEVELKSALLPEEFNGAKWAFQAGPPLLRNGREVYANEGFKPSFTDKRHPRTLWGYDGRRIYWVVVDGRDPWHSRGMTLSELRALAKQFGMKEAVNLDGGGSSGLWWKGVLINHSPGGRERPLPYIIYLE